MLTALAVEADALAAQEGDRSEAESWIARPLLLAAEGARPNY